MSVFITMFEKFQDGYVVHTNEEPPVWKIRGESIKMNGGMYVPLNPGYVLMSDGWKHIKSLKLGDELWDTEEQGMDFPVFPEEN